MNRHPHLFTRENSIFLLIDYQEKFAPVLYDNDQTVKHIKFFLAGGNIYKIPIFISEHVPDKLGKTISDFSEYLKNAYLFTKKTMSCCGANDFISELKKRSIKQIALCGIEAHICVLQTALDLINNGFQVHLVVDAVTTRVAYNKQIAIEKIKAAGGIISSVETVLFEIAYEAGSEEFKELQKLYKSPRAIGF